MGNDGLKKALETKNKLEAKEFQQRKTIDMATSGLKVKYGRLKYVQNHLHQLSDQLKLRQSTMSDYKVQAEKLKKELSDEDNSQEMRENQKKLIKELETLKKDLKKAYKEKIEAEKERNLIKNELDEKM